MTFYRVVTTGDLNKAEFCLVEDPPVGMGIYRCNLALGRPARPYYPNDAKVFLREKNRGIKLTGMLGNTLNCLIGSKLVVEVLTKHCADIEIEYLPFSLYNHKKRLHSADYFFINPLGTLDCLHETASGVSYDVDGDVVTIDKFILDAKKIEKAPSIFRIDKDPVKYVMRGSLAVELQSAGVTNLLGYELKVEG